MTIGPRTFARRASRHWIWPAALLALPDCVDFHAGVFAGPNLDQGVPPLTTLIACDIEFIPAARGRVAAGAGRGARHRARHAVQVIGAVRQRLRTVACA
jgi:hypothetical protein